MLEKEMSGIQLSDWYQGCGLSQFTNQVVGNAQLLPRWRRRLGGPRSAVDSFNTSK